MRLRHYFETGADKAFAAYERFARGTAWSIPHKMELYAASLHAFGNEGPESEQLNAFRDIYSNLVSYWQVFRPHGSSECWTMERIWKTLHHEFASYSQGGELTLKNFIQHREFARLRKMLVGLEDMKPNADYPTMTVSKFLHFFNPSLFPIYDSAVILNRVFKCFEADYDDLCAEMVLDQSACGADFLINYMCWGSHLLSAAPADFMDHFVRWLLETLPQKHFALIGPEKLATLHATAFEFTAIGAAVAEGY